MSDILETILPFLYLPFGKKWMTNIEEGWLYSEKEKAIHGYETHYGIDFSLPLDTPVLAPADGYALGTYHFAYSAKNQFYDNKRVGFGLGNMIEIYFPEHDLFVSLAHLNRFAETVPFVQPRKIEKNGLTTWSPDILYSSIEEKRKLSTAVKHGQVVGFVGASGLTLGYEETPNTPIQSDHNPWDGFHLHLEVYRRTLDKGYWMKTIRIDPYGFYGGEDLYRRGQPAGSNLWVLDHNGLPVNAAL